MWNLEKDPHLSASIANVTILDEPPDPARLRAPPRAGRGDGPPAAPAGRARPSAAWPRRSGGTTPTSTSTTTSAGWRCPRPGSMRQLARPAPRSVATDPFDRTRPLWEFVVVEGLEGGRAAMVQKMHHTITDGEGGIRMSEQFIDLARDATEPIARATARRPSRSPPSLVETTVETLTHNLRRGLGVARRGVEGGAGAGRSTRSRVADARRRTASSSAPIGHAPARSSPTTPTRRCGPSARCGGTSRSSQVPFDEAKARRQGPRREPQRPLRHRRRRRCRGRTTAPAGAPGRRAAHLDAGEHPQGRLGGRQRLHAHPGARAGGHRRPGGALRGRSAPGSPPTKRRAGARAWSTGWPAWPTCCPPRCSCGSPASRWRRSTSRRRTCGARRSPCTSPAPASRPTTRSARPAARRGTSR